MKAEIINYLRPNAKFVYYSVDDKIEWLDETQTQPTEEEITAAAGLVECQNQRVAAYPSIGEQLDALYHYFESENISNDFTAMIKAVKDQYPKP